MLQNYYKTSTIENVTVHAGVIMPHHLSKTKEFIVRSDSKKRKKTVSTSATGFGYDRTFKRTAEPRPAQSAADAEQKPRAQKSVSQAKQSQPNKRRQQAKARAAAQKENRTSLFSNPKQSVQKRNSTASVNRGRSSKNVTARDAQVSRERAPFSYQVTALSTERKERVLAKERGARGQIRKLMQQKDKFFPQAVALVLVVLTALLAFPAMNTALAEAPVAEGSYSAAADEGAVNVALAYNEQQELSTVSAGTSGNTVAIKINGTTAAYCYSKEDAQWVLNQITAAYQGLTYEGKATAPAFLETVTIVSEQGDAMGKEEALLKIANNGDHAVYYIKEGDTAASIAQAYGMTVEELNSMNQGKSFEPNNYIRVKGTGPMANVVTKETLTKDTAIAHKTTTKNDSSLAKGKTKVQTKGVDGVSRTTTTVIYINGQKVGQTENTVTIKEPVTEVILKGTKKVSSSSGSAATGGGGVAGAPNFGWPLRASITSPFGYRWGRLHAGIDMGVSVGTPVKASYGGTVTRAGRAGDYGIMVEINHGNGYVTRYAHNSKVAVKVGQKVSKGQVIAYSGNTGRSTGPHLHFEIRVNGVAKNPLPYLP